MQTSSQTTEPKKALLWETEQGGCGSSTKHHVSQDTFSHVTDLTEITSFSEPSEQDDDEVGIGLFRPINGSYESIRMDSVVDIYEYTDSTACDDSKSKSNSNSNSNSLLCNATSIPPVLDDASFPLGMPSEILWIDESSSVAAAAAADSDNGISVTVHARLQFAELLVTSYKDTLQSNESLIDSLHQNLLQTQGYVEDLMEESDSLLKTMQDMEQDTASKDDRNALVKAAVCFSLFFYVCGGSESLLVASISLYLLQDFANTLFLS